MAGYINHKPVRNELAIYTRKDLPLKSLQKENCNLQLTLTLISIKDGTLMQLNFHPTVFQLCGVLISEVLPSGPLSLTWQHLGQSTDILWDEMRHSRDPQLENGLVHKE